MLDSDIERIRRLPIWQDEVAVVPLGGGRTNFNYVVEDRSGKYVARLGEDIVEHHVMRFNELAASHAAHAARLSPAVVYAQDGLTVLEFVESKTFTSTDVRQQHNLEKILPLVRSCHRDIPAHLRGPVLVFWVFHVIRDYSAKLQEMGSPYAALASELRSIGNLLEVDAGPFDMVFGHNDLLAENILDDGDRLWLIDWDYAGYNSPLFDLGGLASNNGLSQVQEMWMLENYFDAPVTDGLLRHYHAMKCASLLRETMWSMVSEVTSNLDVDYAAYTADFHERFQQTYQNYQQM
ncbi:choline kinase [Rhodobacterales bacterium 52_120_T64]|nr:choline kinase [Rhodobacterales bacterium 52_120_T64]